jgi:hypothetical protein
MTDQIINALEGAESFLNGFADDESQEGIGEMIEACQIAQELHLRGQAIIGAFIEATTTARGRPQDGFEDEVNAAREFLAELDQEIHPQESP